MVPDVSDKLNLRVAPSDVLLAAGVMPTQNELARGRPEGQDVEYRDHTESSKGLI